MNLADFEYWQSIMSVSRLAVRVYYVVWTRVESGLGSKSKTAGPKDRTVARKDWASWCTAVIPLHIPN